ncbi:MAG: hypothetical protein KC455_10135 [Carnobacterium sp.]|nr:hypothetical protein [Carnobacterium sp.]
MERKKIEVSVVYKDNFSEDYKIDWQDLEEILREAEDEDRPDFHIRKKLFIKQEVALIATANCSIQFL